MSTSMFPDQVAALQQLLTETGGFALEVADANHLSLRVVVFVRPGDQDTEPDDGAQCEARWFTISVAGTTREVAADPEQVPA